MTSHSGWGDNRIRLTRSTRFITVSLRAGPEGAAVKREI
jgi:hypothetical protein